MGIVELEEAVHRLTSLMVIEKDIDRYSKVFE